MIHPDGAGDSDNSDSDEELEQPDVVVVEDQSESYDEDYYAMAATAQPPLFYGLHSEDPNTCITNVSWYILTTKANNDKARIAFVSMLLRDEARRWFNSLVINANPGQAADGQAADGQAAPGQAAAVQPPADGPNPPIATFEAFKARFLARFQKNPAELWREQSLIWNVKQRDGQSAEAFLTELQDVAARSQVDEPTIMAAAVAGLRDDVKSAVLQHELATLADLRRWSTVYEMCNPPSRKSDVASAVDRLEQIVQKMAVQSVSEGPARASPAAKVRFDDDDDRPARRRSPERTPPRERDYSPRGGRDSWDRDARTTPRGSYYNSSRGQGQLGRGGFFNRGRGSGGPRNFYRPYQPPFDGNRFPPSSGGPFRQEEQTFNQFNCGRCGRQHERGCCMAISSICNYCRGRGHWAICCRKRYQN